MHIGKRIIMTTSILGTVTAGLIGGLAIPSALRIAEVRDNIVAERAQIDIRYALRNYLRNSLADIKDTKSDLEIISRIAIHEGNELEFIRALERAALATGIQMNLKLETVNQIILSDWEKQIPIKISVVGDFPRITSFLNEVEHLPYYIIFDTLSLSTPRNLPPGSPGAGDVTALFSGMVYWQSEETPDVLKIDNLSVDNN